MSFLYKTRYSILRFLSFFFSCNALDSDRVSISWKNTECNSQGFLFYFDKSGNSYKILLELGEFFFLNCLFDYFAFTSQTINITQISQVGDLQK